MLQSYKVYLWNVTSPAKTRGKQLLEWSSTTKELTEVKTEEKPGKAKTDEEPQETEIFEISLLPASDNDVE